MLSYEDELYKELWAIDLGKRKMLKINCPCKWVPVLICGHVTIHRRRSRQSHRLHREDIFTLRKSSQEGREGNLVRGESLDLLQQNL